MEYYFSDTVKIKKGLFVSSLILGTGFCAFWFKEKYLESSIWLVPLSHSVLSLSSDKYLNFWLRWSRSRSQQKAQIIDDTFYYYSSHPHKIFTAPCSDLTRIIIASSSSGARIAFIENGEKTYDSVFTYPLSTINGFSDFVKKGMGIELEVRDDLGIFEASHGIYID